MYVSTKHILYNHTPPLDVRGNYTERLASPCCPWQPFCIILLTVLSMATKHRLYYIPHIVAFGNQTVPSSFLVACGNYTVLLSIPLVPMATIHIVDNTPQIAPHGSKTHTVPPPLTLLREAMFCLMTMRSASTRTLVTEDNSSLAAFTMAVRSLNTVARPSVCAGDAMTMAAAVVALASVNWAMASPVTVELMRGQRSGEGHIILFTLTFTFRAFRRRLYPKPLTISTFVRRR